MIARRFTVALLVATVLAACEQKPPPTQPPMPETDKEKPATRLLEPERQALEKAKGVEGVVEQGAEERKEAVEKQTN